MDNLGDGILSQIGNFFKTPIGGDVQKGVDAVVSLYGGVAAVPAINAGIKAAEGGQAAAPAAVRPMAPLPAPSNNNGLFLVLGAGAILFLILGKKI